MGTGKILEEIVTGSFTGLMKIINTQIQAQKYQSTRNMNKIMLRHSIIKLLITFEKWKILNAARKKKKLFMYYVLKKIKKGSRYHVINNANERIVEQLL